MKRKQYKETQYEEDLYGDEEFFYEEIDDTYEDEDNFYKSAPAKKSRRHATPIADPIQKGGEAAGRFAEGLARNLSVLLFLAILLLLGYNFVRGSAFYGDIGTAVSTGEFPPVIAAYCLTAAIFLLYDILSMLWSTTRVRYRSEGETYTEDVGRGMWSFIFLYLFSHGAFFVYEWIPDSNEIFRGIQGALNVFGSLHNSLLWLCVAGVFSCLVRRYSSSL